MTHQISRDDLAYSTIGNTKALSDTTTGPFIGLGSGESAKQMDMTGTQSAGGDDRYPYLLDNGNVPMHHFDLNLSMLTSTDDSHSFDFLPDSFTEWPLTYGVQNGHVYSKLQARPIIGDQRMHTLILSQRELQYR